MEIGPLKSSLQSNFGDGLVLVIGSGLSAAEGIPGMAGLAKHLNENMPDHLRDEDKEAWAVISAELTSGVGLEAALQRTPPSKLLEQTITALTASLIHMHEKKVVTQIIEKGRTLRFAKLLPFLLKTPKGTPVITTNYDRLIEFAAEDSGLAVDSLFYGQIIGRLDEKQSRLSHCQGVRLVGRTPTLEFRNRLCIYKPHGSLDWYSRDGIPLRYPGNLPLPRMIITPGLNKYQAGYNPPFDKHREYANRELDQARSIVIVGYGFNDSHLETHLMPAIRSGKPTLVLTYELSSTAVSLAKECKNVTAIERQVGKAGEGSTVYHCTECQDFPGLNIWDLGEFVKEVLTP